MTRLCLAVALFCAGFWVGTQRAALHTTPVAPQNAAPIRALVGGRGW